MNQRSSVFAKQTAKQPDNEISEEKVMKPALLVIDVQNEFFNLNQTCSNSLKGAIE